MRVTILDRGEAGREASWAGAGILPVGSWYSDHPALEAMAHESFSLHEDWSLRLRSETGVDDQYERCGAQYYETQQNSQHLAAVFHRWETRGVEVEPVEPPAGYRAAWSIPAEAQVRNPRRLRALVEGCRRRGVRLLENTTADGFRVRAGRVESVATPTGEFFAAEFVLAAGCWSPGLTSRLALNLPGKPIRGQMLLLRLQRPGPVQIRHAFPYYIVTRRDGRALVGATVEDVGFARGTTSAARSALEAAARRLAPDLLEGAEVERFWSGLRPRGSTELPVIGRAEEPRNLWIATGHYRSGLQLAPATAELIAMGMRGDLPPEWAESFAPTAFAVSQESL